MPQAVINGVGKLAVRNPAALDSDAVAFITAATITNETQKTAVNDLVVDLKAAGLWTKMKALYPMVGGTAASHKWNLRDPRDLDAAFRLNFIGGWTHSSTGATPNGTTGYADTNFNPTANSLTSQNWHVGYYSRTNVSNSGNIFGGYYICHGPILNQAGNFYLDWPGFNSNPSANAPGRITDLTLNTTTNAMFIFNATSTNVKVFKNTATLKTTNSISTGIPNQNIFLNLGYTSGFARFDSRQCAFASIGNGLTDLESSLFYQIVEKFQAALSRNINASQTFYYNKNYSNEVNAFIFNGGITDATQISATNTLVNTLKTAGIWTKMKAVYPMVGGTSTSTKFNLVNPVDRTSAYALTYVGGWTFGSSGATPNGSNSHANTNLIAGSVLTTTSAHLSFYTPSNITGYFVDIGARNGLASGNPEIMIIPRDSNFNSMYTFINSISNARLLTSVPTSAGFSFSTRNSTTHSNFKNGIKLGSITSNSGAVTSYPIFIGAQNETGTTSYRSTRTCSFASIGEGLTDAEALTFYNAVQAFQTTLGRQV